MARPKVALIQKLFCRQTGSRMLLVVLLLFFELQLSAQNKENAFIIYFTDKLINEDANILSQKALERRSKYNIPLSREDYPVDQAYIDRVCADTSIHFRYALKWHNAIVVSSRQSELIQIKNESFVKKVAYVGKTTVNTRFAEQIRPLFNYAKQTDIVTDNLSKQDYGKSFDQLEQIGVDKMHSLGYDGEGIYVAVFDAGFMNVNVLSSYTRLRANMKLFSGYDLVDLDNILTDTDNHGTAVSSCMASFDKGKFIGGSPNATFFLFRTENSATEYPLEELNWCKAAEIADSLGVDMISSSLGYTQYDDTSLSYRHKDLNGTTSYISFSARKLVERGVLVVNSAGNEGDDHWLKIGTPSDVPVVLSVGAVDINNKIGSFSSRGLNANGVIKPDLCALGVKATVSSTYGSYYQGFGTSYATPILSSGIACLMQAHPDKNPYEIATALRLSASRNAFPDSVYGYGVANIYAAHILLDSSKQLYPTLLDSGLHLLLYKMGYETTEIKVSEKRSFLLFFKRLTPVQKLKIQSDLALQYVDLDEDIIECSKKYTLQIRLRGPVDNCKLKYKDISFCSP